MKRLVCCIVLLTTFCLGQGYNAHQVSSFTGTGTAPAIREMGGSLFHQLFWTKSGTVTTCTISVESSSDNITWTPGGIITNQTCTSNGNTVLTSGSANFVRVNLTVFSGGGTLNVTYNGYASNGGGAVTSVFGRNGVVTAQTGDYTYAQVTGAAGVTGTPTDGNCLKNTLSGGNVTVADAGFPCVAPSAVPTQVVQSGLMAEYRLTEGTGTTITDSSGNGNTGTFGAGGNAPTWVTPSGLAFAGGQFVSLPAALNTARTIQLIMSFQFAGASQYNGIISAAPNTATKCSVFMLDNAHGVSGGGTNQHFETWDTNFRATSRYTVQGTASVTWEINTSGQDLLQVNNSGLVTFGNFLGTLGSNNYQLGGAAGGGASCITPAHYMVGNIYYVVVYNRMLTQAEVNQNNEFLTQVMLARGQPITTGSTSTTDLFVFDGDSEPSFVGNSMMTLTPTINPYNLAFAGSTIEQLVADAPYAIDSFFQLAGNRQTVLMWGGTNDSAGSATTTINYLSSYCKARHKLGFTCGIVTMMDRGGASAFKNAYDTAIRTTWTTFADYFVDVGADYLLGCDGCNLNTTYMTTGLHPTPASANNIVAPMVQRGVNRYYGNKSWSTANVYTTGAAAATAITATSESTNTVTVTSTLNPPLHSCVVISGVTPAGYNNVTNECWNVLTTSATNFTYFNFVTGLGAGSVFGTASVPMQQDVDVFTRLGGSAAGNPQFTLQTCNGYTGQRLYLKNENTTSAWVLVPFMSETIDGAATLTMPTASAGNLPVVILESQLVSSAAGGCNWARIQ